ncbi:MAG: hypothetical protein U0359_22310 [Byssovorax sp.]
MRTAPIFTSLLVLLLSAGVASADVPDADRATARALANEGQDALERADFATAADRFGRADALLHAPPLLLGLARAQVGLGKLVSAQETYQRVLREELPRNPPRAFVRALADAKLELDALRPRIARVTITIEGAADVAVTLDGDPVPSAAISVQRPMDPGRHVVRAVAGRAVAEVIIEAAEGGTYQAPLVLKTPAADLPAPPLRPASASPPARAAARGSPRKTAGYVTLGLGSAGLALGVGTGIAAMVQRGSIADQCVNGICPKSAQDAVDSYHLFGTISTASVVIGGAAAAAGVILIVTAPSPPPREATIAPLVGPGFLGVKGSFQ